MGLITNTGAYPPWRWPLTLFALTLVLLSSLSFADRQALDLTGIWSGDDGATYYVLAARDSVWWVGLSSDGGRSFTNVFRGRWQVNNSVGDPGDYGTVDGEWADVPRGESIGSGKLRLSYRFSRELKKVNGSGFRCATWKKLDPGNAPRSIEVIKNPFPQKSDLSGIWTTNSGTYYLRQLGTTVWWFGLRQTDGGNTEGEVFQGTINGTRLSGRLAFPPWPGSENPGVNILNAQLDRQRPPNSFTAFGELGFYEQGTTWTRINVSIAGPPRQ